jgi:uncharacterized delta-60 repeat protein
VNGRRSRPAALLALIAVALALAAAPAAASASTMIVQPDGRILVGGYAYPGFGGFARFGADGRLDPSFGRKGVAVSHALHPIGAIAPGPNGGFYAAASRFGSPFPSPVLAGFLADGRPNPGFGGGGGVSTPTESGQGAEPTALVPTGVFSALAMTSNHCCYKYGPPSFATVEGIAESGEFVGSTSLVGPSPSTLLESGYWLGDMMRRPDGSLIAVGYGPRPGKEANVAGILLTRFPADFSQGYDKSFGAGDGVVVGAAGTAFAVAEDEGKILVGGLSGTQSATTRTAYVTRYVADGELDEGFGDKGGVTLQIPNSIESRVNAVAVAPDGSIFAAGTNRQPRASGSEPVVCNGCEQAFVAKLKPDGAIDPSFGEGGVELLGSAAVPPMSGLNLDLLADGRILVSGSGASPENAMHVVRLLSEGQVDPTFGSDGLATAVPCAGKPAVLRRNGCLPAARAGLTLAHLGSRRPVLRFSLRPSVKWARISGVQLILPKALRLRGEGEEPGAPGVAALSTSHPITPTLHPHSVNLASIGYSRWIKLSLRDGAFRAVKPLAPRRKLRFRVVVKFGEPGRAEGTQTVVLTRRP